MAVNLAVVAAIGCSAESKKSRLLTRANSYFDSDEYDKAKIEYLNVLRSDPQNATAIQRLGTIWYEQGAPLRAAPFLLKTRDLLPDDIDSRDEISFCFPGGWDNLRRRGRKPLPFWNGLPANGEAMLILVESSRSQEELDDAETTAPRPQHETTKQAFIWRWQLFRFGKKISLPPRTRLKQALALNPSSVEAHLALAKLYWCAKDLPNADREFKAAAELAPPSPWRTLIMRNSRCAPARRMRPRRA